jgi:hypothetical protein
MRILQRVAIAIVVCVTAMPLVAQTSGTQQSKPAIDTSKQGIPLSTDLTVQGNVTVQAVLIPHKIAKAVFGGKIADEYAIVQLTINNKSSDAALIVQGVYIDYSRWALAGGGISGQPCAEEASTEPKSKFADCTKPSQVASEEYRVVRGQALNAQTWTWRNGIVRGLTFAGSVATAYAFTVSGTKYPKAVSGATGTFIPGLGTFWPDQTIDQINRISDLGYQTNKVVSKQGSDIIVCFFPIDRFLTSGFRQIFLKEPALFFSPYELLLDKKVRERFFSPHGIHPTVNPKDILDALGISKPNDLAKALPCYLDYKEQLGRDEAKAAGQEESKTQNWAEDLRSKKDTDCGKSLSSDQIQQLDTLAHVSLNTIHVVIDGVMTVETAKIPAKIQSITFDNERTDANLWVVPEKTAATPTPTTTIKGTITGAYLTDATPIVRNQDLGISDVAVISEGSNDQTLHFSLKLSKTIPNQTELTFVVEKKPTDSKAAPVDSTPFVYRVQYAGSNVPLIDNVSFENDQTEPALWKGAGKLTGTINGRHLSGGTNTVKAMIENSKDLGISDPVADKDKSNDLQVQFTVTLSKAIDDGKPLKLTVETFPKDESGAPGKADSGAYTYVVHYRPKIGPISFEGETTAAVWKDTRNPLKGSITGDNLAKCTPKIKEAKDLNITDLKVDGSNSTDQLLKFSIQLGSELKSGDTLTFTVSKPAKDADGKDIGLESNAKQYKVPSTGKNAATPSNPKGKGKAKPLPAASGAKSSNPK